jgi:E3 ubiquitin-protein ligase TRIP12
VEDYCLYFYDPADETIELIKDGAETAVTLHNLQQYIDLVLDSAFNYSVYLQIYAFKKGFS